MKKLILALAFASFCLQALAQGPSFIFFEGTYAQMQTRAANAQKPYFLYFYANWSMQCKDMNATLQNKYVIEYAQERYLGMQFDGESIITEGKKLADHFGIIYYPTVIIFSPYGKELKRIYGHAEPAELLAELRKYEKSQAKPGEGENKPPKPSYVPKDGEYLFKMAVTKQPYEGYGIQVGVFGSYRNAFVQLLKLEEEHAQRNVLVHVQEEPDRTLFKLILGPFDSRQRAENYLKVLGKQGIKGVVVTLDDMEE